MDSATATASQTATFTETLVYTPTATGTQTATFTVSPIASPTDTGTQTATFTASPSSTASPTPSATSTATRTATASPTLSGTATGTRTATSTPSASATATGTGTATASPTRSATGTVTATVTNSFTASPSPFGTRTASPTVSPTFTASPSQTSTRSATHSPTGTFSASPSSTGTRTATPTATSSASPTGTKSWSPSPAATFTSSPTTTGTRSATSSPLPSATNSPTATRSATPTGTASFTPTGTGTRTATPLPSSTPTPSRTATYTASPTRTSTASATRTPSPTNSPVPTTAPTNTAQAPCNGVAMTTDGILNETIWGQATPVAIPAGNCNYGTGCGTVDLTANATYKTVWSATGLWIGVVVSDPGTLYANTGAPWNGSGVEIFLDLNNTRGGYNTTSGNYNDANTYQWSVTFDSAAKVQYHNATARTIATSTKSTPGVGYTMEISIPWAALGVAAPSAGAISGLNIAVDVANTAGNARDHQIVAYNGSFNPYDQTPAQWGGVQYNACNSYTATNTPVVTATYTPTRTATIGVTATFTPVTRGASLPYDEYEAEAGSWGGGATLFGANRSIFTTGGNLGTEKSAEASGRQAVELTATNQYVQWTTKNACNSIVVRLAVPDGFNGTLGVFIGAAGSPQIELQVSGKYSWEYDNWNIPYNESGSKPFHIYDEAHALLGVEVPAGTVIKLMRTSADTAAYYTIDLVDLEEAPAALGAPANSVVPVGADTTGNSDSTTALQNCINSAASSGKIAFFPAGTYKISNYLTVPAVTVQGAGMWRTTIHQTSDTSVIRFNLNGSSAMVADMLLTGEVTNRNDGNTDSAFDNHGGTGTLVKNVWTEHTKCGWWVGNTNSVTNNLTITGCRFRDSYADGINFCNGTSNSTITQSHFRGNGDDAIASWSPSGGGVNNGNSFTWNTIQCTWRADSIAVYGGSNFTITDNLCSDTLDQSGIMVQQGFGSNGFSGTNNILRNTLTRCGGYFNGNYGAIDFWANQGAINGNWNVTSLDIESSTFSGFEYSGSTVNGVTVNSSVVNNAGTWGVEVTGGTGGTTTFNNTNVNGSGSGALTTGSMAVNRSGCNF